MAGKKVYGYIRVSTDTQSEKGYGLVTQRQAIEKYCQENGLELADTFEDRGISGTEAVENDGEGLVSKRKGLLKLLSMLDHTNTIVVLNTSRLWRSDIAKVLIRREIERKGGEVISIEQPRYSIYQKEPSEVLINGMFELLDEYERISISLKLAKGRGTKAFRGDKPAGATPYGYQYSADKKKIVVVDDEAATVKRMFKLIQSGNSVGRIAEILNLEGIATRQGKPWSKATVHGMLTNPFYTGVLTHQQTEIQGNHDAIINKITFGKVRATLRRNRKKANGQGAAQEKSKEKGAPGGRIAVKQ